MVIGRVGRDPEMKVAGTGTAICNFSVAVNRKGRGEDKETDWFNVVAFGQTAEFVNKYVTKGTLVAVDGRLQINVWEDSAGNKRTAPEIVADQVRSLEKSVEKTTPVVEETVGTDEEDPFGE